MLQYEYKQINGLIDSQYTLVNMLRSAIDSASSTIEQFVEKDKQKEAYAFFTKNMITITNENKEDD